MLAKKVKKKKLSKDVRTMFHWVMTELVLFIIKVLVLNILWFLGLGSNTVVLTVNKPVGHASYFSYIYNFAFLRLFFLII